MTGLPSTGTTWQTALEPTLNPLAVRYWQITDVLICDYYSGIGNPLGVGSPNNWAATSVGLGSEGLFTPFAADGNLRSDLLSPYHGVAVTGLNCFYHIGELKKDSTSITPDETVQETPTAQSVRTVRNVQTKLQDKVSFTPVESSPLVDYLRYELPLVDGLPDVGTAGYQVVRPPFDQLQERTVVLLGVDNNTGNLRAEVFPRVVTDKKGKTDLQRENPESLELTYSVLVDPFTQSVSWTCRDGVAWRALAGAPTFSASTVTAAAVTGLKATLTFVTPTGLDLPVTYSVTQQVGGSGSFTTSTLQSPTGTISGSNTVLTVTGLTATTAYVFQVTATGTNDATTTLTNSNSVTSTSS